MFWVSVLANLGWRCFHLEILSFFYLLQLFVANLMVEDNALSPLLFCLPALFCNLITLGGGGGGKMSTQHNTHIINIWLILLFIHVCSLAYLYQQTRKKLLFVRKPIFRIEKCPQIHIFPNHTKVTYIDFFPKILEIFEEK